MPAPMPAASWSIDLKAPSLSRRLLIALLARRCGLDDAAAGRFCGISRSGFAKRLTRVRRAGVPVPPPPCHRQQLVYPISLSLLENL